MTDRPCPKVLVCLLALALSLPGCASTKGNREQPTPEARSSPRVSQSPFRAQGQQQPRTTGQTSAVHKSSAPESAQATPSPREHVEAGEYQKALDTYGASYRNRPRGQALTTEYVESVEGMKLAADKACEKKEYASAGRIYDLLLKYYGQFKDFARVLTFDRAYLNHKLSLCKKSLSVGGFQEYRKGNLSEAIRQWQDLLSIDPNNEDIKKAMNTATEQQKNLQRKK